MIWIPLLFSFFSSGIANIGKNNNNNNEWVSHFAILFITHLWHWHICNSFYVRSTWQYHYFVLPLLQLTNALLHIITIIRCWNWFSFFIHFECAFPSLSKIIRNVSILSFRFRWFRAVMIQYNDFGCKQLMCTVYWDDSLFTETCPMSNRKKEAIMVKELMHKHFFPCIAMDILSQNKGDTGNHRIAFGFAAFESFWMKVNAKQSTHSQSFSTFDQNVWWFLFFPQKFGWLIFMIRAFQSIS